VGAVPAPTPPAEAFQKPVRMKEFRMFTQHARC
jgi:hypothetical protein